MQHVTAHPTRDRSGGGAPVSPSGWYPLTPRSGGWDRLVATPVIRAALGGDRPRRDLAWLSMAHPDRVLDVGARAGFARHLRSAAGARADIVVSDVSASPLREIVAQRGRHGLPNHRLSFVKDPRDGSAEPAWSRPGARLLRAGGPPAP